jgi:hypothetical protein
MCGWRGGGGPIVMPFFVILATFVDEMPWRGEAAELPWNRSIITWSQGLRIPPRVCGR